MYNKKIQRVRVGTGQRGGSMYGAILGDMIGAPYEFDRGNKTKEFPLFVKQSHFTDDNCLVPDTTVVN